MYTFVYMSELLECIRLNVTNKLSAGNDCFVHLLDYFLPNLDHSFEFNLNVI